MVSAMRPRHKRQGRATAPAPGFPFSGDLDENVAMIIPDVLALDFDGVLCDGMREYFETSRRTYAKAWPEEPAPGEDLLPAFRRLRPGDPLGLGDAAPRPGHRPRATRGGDPRHWAAVRDELAASGPRHGDALIGLLKTALDQVRREWIARRPPRLARG